MTERNINRIKIRMIINRNSTILKKHNAYEKDYTWNPNT